MKGFERAKAGDSLRELVAAFAAAGDPRIGVLSVLPDSDRPTGALLATVLGQDIGIGVLARLVRELHARLGASLLSVGISDWPQLERACRFPWLAEWPHKDSLAGWVLAVSDFLRTHGMAGSWETSFCGPKAFVAQMARELPWMGSRSPSRIKGWRLARWTVRGECGASGWSREARRELTLPVAAVERGLKTLSLLPAGWETRTLGARQEWLDAILVDAAPDDPTAAWMPLETVLARGRSGPACQELLGSCRNCPVRSRCPSPGRI